MKDNPRSLAWRLYTFAALIVIVSVGTLIATLMFDGTRPEDNQVRAVQALVNQLDARFPDDAALVGALHREPTLRTLDLFVYDRQGQLLGGVGRPLDPPTEEELQVEDGAPHLDHRRIVVAMGRDRVLVHRPDGPGPRWFLITLSVVVGGSLAIALVVTLVFARTLVRPLRILGDAARAFGRGETSVRTRLTRRDELGAVGHAFDEMADKIDQLLRTQRAMMADISHELRTPLTRIKLALDLASADPQAAQNVLDGVDVDLEEIEQIIEDVFEVVRLDSADAAIRRRELDLFEIVVHAWARFAAPHAAHPISLDTTLDHARCEGDGALIRRALDNLLDNAAKYSADGSPIALRLRRQGDRFEIEVADQGIGMSTGELALAFTPFWRADGSRARETGGVGLGLALARRIARAHGGDVELESSRSAGTIARLTLDRTPRTGPHRRP
jgi:two-component system OmpR family sensor kinase